LASLYAADKPLIPDPTTAIFIELPSRSAATVVCHSRGTAAF
jgi:hypothetical protein